MTLLLEFLGEVLLRLLFPLVWWIVLFPVVWIVALPIVLVASLFSRRPYGRAVWDNMVAVHTNWADWGWAIA